jgi:DNA modification methylase
VGGNANHGTQPGRSLHDSGRTVWAGLKPKDLIGIPWRVAFALQADGWYLRQDIIWSKPNPMPESVTDRPTKAHEYLFLLTKRQRYYYDAEAIAEPGNPSNYRANPSIRAVPPGSTSQGKMDTRRGEVDTSTRNRRSVWTVNTQPYPEAHFATFPEKLVEPCVLAGSRPGDLVLDPFAGSGTVGVVCRRFARRFVGVELNPDYVVMARARLAGQLGMALEPAV